MSKNPDDFGEPCGGSRWFNADPVLMRVPMRPIRVSWSCPIDGCQGEMINTGEAWTTNPPGYHHRCNACGFTAALEDKRYPQIEFEPSRNPFG